MFYSSDLTAYKAKSTCLKQAVLSLLQGENGFTYDKIIVGLSGGLDSTVLLDVLYNQLNHLSVAASLSKTSSSKPRLARLITPKLSAIHINHQLSPHHLEWEAHCQQLCKSYNIPLLIKRVNIKQKSNLEEAARKARYAVFLDNMNPKTGLILAHHQQDQAETVLLQLFRGAGVEGISGMPIQKKFGSGMLLRPFLMQNHDLLKQYAVEHHLKWISDDSNNNTVFSRNFLRHQIMPLLKERWPGLTETLSRTAINTQEARKNLQALAYLDCPAMNWKNNKLPLESLLPFKQQPERLHNILRRWLQANSVIAPSKAQLKVLIKEVISAKEDANPVLKLSDVLIKRYQDVLYILRESAITAPEGVISWKNFPEEIKLTSVGQKLCAHLSDSTDDLYVPNDAKLDILFRKGGECIVLQGQTKKLKKLFQEWQVLPWIREQIPLLFINGELAAVPGFAISDKFKASRIDLLKREGGVYHLMLSE